jgi:hypothetical protein
LLSVGSCGLYCDCFLLVYVAVDCTVIAFY